MLKLKINDKTIENQLGFNIDKLNYCKWLWIKFGCSPKAHKINYEMELLLNKMREMNRKPQKYHPKSQKFFPHPSSLRFSSTSHKQYELDNANKYLKNKYPKALKTEHDIVARKYDYWFQYKDDLTCFDNNEKTKS